jgi:hypothetical protein
MQGGQAGLGVPPQHTDGDGARLSVPGVHQGGGRAAIRADETGTHLSVCVCLSGWLASQTDRQTDSGHPGPRRAAM